MDFNNVAISHKNNATNKTFTENGEIINTSTTHLGLDVFNKLVRDEGRNLKTGKVAFKNANKRIPKNSLELETPHSPLSVKQYYGAMLDEIYFILNENKQYTNDKKQLIYDTFVLPFYKRCFNKTVKNNGKDVKYTGEGEKLIFYQMFIELLKYFPDVAIELITEIPKIGYWGDLFNIWQLIDKRNKDKNELELDIKIKNLYCINVLYLVINQLLTDIYLMENNKPCSLVAKWIPREGSSKDKACKLSQLNTINYSINSALSILFKNKKEFICAASKDYFIDLITNILKKSKKTNLNSIKRKFRQTVSKLNKYISTTETMMCSHNWQNIEPSKIPSRAMLKYRIALLNEIKNKSLSIDEEKTGNRYPQDIDRVNARNNIINHLVNGNKINVSSIEPHEILNAYIKSKSSVEKMIIQKQWEAKIEEVFMEFVNMENLDINDPLSLKTSRACNLIPMMDVSGSMIGIPMDVSIGLGLFLVALQKRFGLEKQIAISFTNNPYVFDLTNMTLKEQIQHLYNNVGYNTNFESAVDLVLESIKISNQHKDLIVFTDGQFDSMNNNTNWQTSHQKIMQKAVDLGLTKIPNIIYWNLRLNTPGVQTTSSHPGVQLLQGYSPNIVKFALYGNNLNDIMITVQDSNNDTKNIVVNDTTPYDTYRTALDQECFDNIRNIVSKYYFNV